MARQSNVEKTIKGLHQKEVFQGQGKLAFGPVEAKVAKEAFRLASRGYGCNTISQKLNEADYLTRRKKRWSKTGINQMLRNTAYIGHTRWGKREKNGSGYKKWTIA